MQGRILGFAAFAALATAVPAQGAPVAKSTAVDRARTAIERHADAVRGGANQAFAVKDVIADDSGASHVRFTRSYRGLRVLGGDLVVHSGDAGAFRGASLTLAKAPAGSGKPGISGDRAAQIAGGDPAGEEELVVDATAGQPRLAWLVTVKGTQADGTPSVVERTVDAATGDVIDSQETVETAADDTSLYVGLVDLTASQSGSTWLLQDPTRGNSRTADAGASGTPVFTDADNVWGGGAGNRQTAAVDVHYGSAKTWDYYKTVHGRTGIDGAGTGALSRVHYGTAYNNAFWQDSCYCMTYGDGDGKEFNPLVGLDVTGHEMSHGVTSHTAGLKYSGESGGLNESTSDIFGTLVEFYAANPNDPGDYTIGEEISANGRPLRYMDQPSKDGGSADCWSRQVGRLDVHYSSGVGNHFFYLLAHGGTSNCTGGTVTGIGNDAAGRIWYRALTTYMTSRTNYADARVASLNAARDLFGAGSVQYNAVAAAWTAVKVN